MQTSEATLKVILKNLKLICLRTHLYHRLVIPKGIPGHHTPHMFSATLVTMARKVKLLKQHSTDEWINENVVHIYDVILLSCKENEILKIADN